MKIGVRLALVAVLSTGLQVSADAATLWGKVTFVGTLTEEVPSTGVYYARFRVRLKSTCSGDVPGTISYDRWLHFRSGRMDGGQAHNATNTRNAYNTFMTAFLTGNNVQVDGAASTCSSSQTINLWSAQVGIY